MTDESDTATAGWFSDLDPSDLEGATAAVLEGRRERPADWPTLAVDAGFADDESAYYDRLHEATTAATRGAVREREAADDRQLVHAIRAMDDCERTSNELAERLAEWGGTVDPNAGTGLEYARELTTRDTDGDARPDDATAGGPRLQSLAERVVSLADEADELREYVERETPTIAPNLAALAGPVLAARLISLAGGLEELAKKPSGTVQVLGAEDALFAHLRGHAPSPKHGIIYVHDAVRGTHPDERGSAARALAGKLAIAARVDHYSGDRRPELEAELAQRIETIQARTDDETTKSDTSERNGGSDA
ncbi:NOP58 family protein [Salinadaptatus halalkaliphilus]|uniref:NOP58 family protein n=1 Tax=Salinadaptatus halalkaliphilus TaxID=2419781 RepID=A0A4S3TTK9_9EURY|nr:NOP5/NOP56 family protein [Salinadaptatus halalkaliphilus]THE65958.1 NOP58 family protein [Salinadaptatus halalkaliphilus]